MTHISFSTISLRLLAAMAFAGAIAVTAFAQDAGTSAAKAGAPNVAAASSCKGLDAKSCSAGSGCLWIVPAKVNAKTGKVRNPYCRKAPKRSVCSGLSESACGQKSQCAWTKPRKADAKTGKVPQPYCKKAPKAKAKKA